MGPGFSGDHRCDVVVVGGGLSGCAAAVDLARRGLDVIVLEAAATSTDSGGADGCLWAGPGPFYAEAVAAWGHERAREVWHLHLEAAARLAETLAALGDDCGHRAAGGFTLVRTRPDAALLHESEDLLREDGLAGEFLDGYMLESRFDVTGFAAGYWSEAETQADVRRLTAGLADAARAAGVRLFEKAPVRHLDVGKGVQATTDAGSVSAGAALVAAGLATASLVPPLAPALSTVGSEVSRFALAAGPHLPSPARLERSASWRIGPAGLEHAVRDGAGPCDVSHHLAGLGPRLESRMVRRAAGPDGLPLCGMVPGLPLAVAAGYAGIGGLSAVAGGQWAAAALVDGSQAVPEPLRAARLLARPAFPQ